MSSLSCSSIAIASLLITLVAACESGGPCLVEEGISVEIYDQETADRLRSDEEDACAAVCTEGSNLGPEDVIECTIVDRGIDEDELPESVGPPDLGLVGVSCTYLEQCVGGRGHAALQPARGSSMVDAAGQWLARMAHAEAASVTAFEAIADELEALGAPPELVARARQAAGDEVRHARIMGALAQERGVQPERPRWSAIERRELEALAIENAVEGCVRETWGALEACWQAGHAQDPAVRRAMQTIARDEARHAQLSWDLDRWARARLDAAALARVDAARERAVAQLGLGIGVDRGDALHEAMGLPRGAIATRLWTELRASLWS